MAISLKLALILTLFSWIQPCSSNASEVPAHERLRLENTFKFPEEVVNYYCARDAEGFVWSGFLEAEREAFTLWSESPKQDSFYIAKKYSVSPHKLLSANEATVNVTYSIAAIGDAQGSRLPAPEADMSVEFNLRKVNGSWKIYKPDASQVAPVLLESRYPFHAL